MKVSIHFLLLAFCLAAPGWAQVNVRLGGDYYTQDEQLPDPLDPFEVAPGASDPTDLPNPTTNLSDMPEVPSGTMAPLNDTVIGGQYMGSSNYVDPAPAMPGPMNLAPLNSPMMGESVLNSTPTYQANEVGNNSCEPADYGAGGGMGLRGFGLANALSSSAMYMFVDIGSFQGDSEACILSNTYQFDMGDNLIRGAGIGRYLTQDLRVDVSTRYRFAEVDPGSVAQVVAANPTELRIDGGSNVWSTLLTARHNLPGLHPCIKPYLSGGIGFADHNTHGVLVQTESLLPPGGSQPVDVVTRTAYDSNDMIEFAWAVGGGLSFKMTRNMFIDVDYQYVNLGEALSGFSDRGDQVNFEDITGHEVVLRFRYDF